MELGACLPRVLVVDLLAKTAAVQLLIVTAHVATGFLLIGQCYILRCLLGNDTLHRTIRLAVVTLDEHEVVAAVFDVHFGLINIAALSVALRVQQVPVVRTLVQLVSANLDVVCRV